MSIDHELIGRAFSPKVAQANQVRSFDVSFDGDPMVEIMIGGLLQPEGYCLNCGETAFSFNGQDHSCMACGSRHILRTSKHFPVTKSLLNNLHGFLLSIS